MRRISPKLAAAATILSFALAAGINPAAAGSSDPPRILAGNAGRAVAADPPAHGLQTQQFSTAESMFHRDTFNQGWWAATHTTTRDNNDNYFVGRCCREEEIRDFFTFDLSSLKHRVVFAQLRVESGDVRGHAHKQLGLFDISTPAAVLNHNTTLNPEIFADLGTGTSYGTFDVKGSQDYEVLSLSLNRSAIRDINNANGGFFSIGGRLLSLKDADRQEFIFGATGWLPVKLVVRTVPAQR